MTLSTLSVKRMVFLFIRKYGVKIWFFYFCSHRKTENIFSNNLCFFNGIPLLRSFKNLLANNNKDKNKIFHISPALFAIKFRLFGGRIRQRLFRRADLSDSPLLFIFILSLKNKGHLPLVKKEQTMVY